MFLLRKRTGGKGKSSSNLGVSSTDELGSRASFARCLPWEFGKSRGEAEKAAEHQVWAKLGLNGSLCPQHSLEAPLFIQAAPPRGGKRPNWPETDWV